MKASTDTLVVTCEHGGRIVPPELRQVFREQSAVLHSHRGWDPGALTMARHLARVLNAPLHAATVSRLVVDPNRSPHHGRLFSELTRPLDDATRQALLARYYVPYRSAVEAAVAGRIADHGFALHLSVHSFTPLLDGQRREADIGLLYDPGRRSERLLAERLRGALLARLPDLRVRSNYPYRGVADGFTTHLRRQHGTTRYAGIELEVNQQHIARPAAHWLDLRRAVGEALRDMLLP